MPSSKDTNVPFRKPAMDEEESMLPNEDDETQYYTRSASNDIYTSQKWLPVLASFIFGALVVLALGSLFQHGHSSRQLGPGRTMPVVREGIDNQTGLPNNWLNGDCGNSPADAEARGCRFSMVLLAWVPPTCLSESDAEDDRLMFEGKDWPLIIDGRSVPWTEVQKGHFSFFNSSMGWHTTHCMFAWKRLHRVMLNASQQLDSYLANVHHTHHCVGVLERINGNFSGSAATEVGVVKFPTCA
ncbi:hypothetical protein HIM_06598 [Hirsutella minnesotensis 3608]|uniref:Uncharacterized protein n=1 Tax=Hirsutella minnesotensis 3608 TaxID=1043627 RepID=A0A0F7ZNK9_9HYPO|nr:hypothetical protein HIM_06598 [Hirsutella minnesotensis 3608]